MPLNNDTKDRLMALPQYIVPHHLLSRLIGWFAETQWAPIKEVLIEQFIKFYKVDMSEAEEENPKAYNSFNAFFTRALKQSTRPISKEKKSIACPADGAVSQVGDIEKNSILQAKGHNYSLTDLLGGDNERATPFINGKFATIYLSPSDYHRVHMPLTGVLREMIYIPGRLFSVNQRTTEQVDGLFARNERVVAIFDTDHGPVAAVMVGAMIVASIEMSWAGLVTPPKRQLKVSTYTAQARRQIKLKKGEEMGRFKLGSTVILLFGKDAVQWSELLRPQTSVRMGENIGEVL